MTTDVQLFKNGVPSYLKAQPLNAITKALLGSGKTTKKISIRGNVFRLVVNGKEIAASEERSMKVVIVNVAPKVHRTFYSGVFDPNTKAESPECWSADGERPDESIDGPQSEACHNCEKNISGSGTGKTKACKFGRMVAVVLENDLSGDVFQLSLPAQSIFGDAEGGNMPLNAYAQFLAGFNVNVTAVVTEMRFDIDSATPKLFFKAVRPLVEEEFDALTLRGETPEVKALVKVSFAPRAEVATAAVPKLPNKVKAKDVEDEAEEVAEPTQPKKRESKKEEPSTKKNLASVLDQWDDEE
jgi:hypothetical protein